MPIQPGEFRARVAFYKRTGSGNAAYGNTKGGFGADPEFTVAARIQPRLGGESVTAARLTGSKISNVTVRRSANTALVTTEWRAVNVGSNAVYNIRSIIDPFEHTADHGKYFEMLCEEGVAS